MLRNLLLRLSKLLLWLIALSVLLVLLLRWVPPPFTALMIERKIESWRTGEAIDLTAMEFDLVLAFAERPGRVLTRAQLLDIAHPGGSDPFDRSIDVRITRLRRKIERNAAAPTLIRTVRGAGYVYDG